ncbi:receptor-like serine/threonine-protein kinase SD1-8 isoform X1 [Canna indica]|uniref:Receptor-like serine/threonine-protein kinase SD1-8 isoform X1 n=1 Tax=Canna indica TaxID=4628 RepID=A0AAQ3KUA0_9LILI|nr:receptor-like serine/threonine-protein kinase SD1-8 isoform X1 [Canna indica]
MSSFTTIRSWFVSLLTSPLWIAQSDSASGIKRKLGVPTLKNDNVSLQQLVSWKNSTEPSLSDYNYEMRTRGVAEFYIKQDPNILFRTGPWNDRSFSENPDFAMSSQLKYSFVTNRFVGIYYLTLAANTSILTRAAIKWVSDWYLPNVKCHNYSYCVANTICRAKYTKISCKCMDKFVSNGKGCVRRKPLNYPSDKFQQVFNVKLPNTVNTTADKSRNTHKMCK